MRRLGWRGLFPPRQNPPKQQHGGKRGGRPGAEAFGSLLLAVLVFLSLFQTGRLWYFSHLPIPAPPAEYDLQVERSGVDLGELLQPLAIILHQEGGKHLEFRPGQPGYSSLWQEGLALLPLQDGPLIPVAYAEVRQARQEGVAVEYILPARLTVDQYRQAWGLERGKEEGPTIDRLLLRFTKTTGSYFLDNGQGEAYFSGKSLTVGDLSLHLPRGAGNPVTELPTVFRGISLSEGLYVPLVSPVISGLALAPTKVASEQEARLFFVDPSLARKVEERDGAVFYTDGVGGLRIYPTGDLEYSLPQPDRPPVKSRAALQKVAAFLKAHGGIPEGSFVKEIRPNPSSQAMGEGRVEVSVVLLREGLPLLGGNFPLEFQLTENGVSRFTRILRPISGPSPIKRTVVPVENLLSQVVKGEDEPRRQIPRLTDVYLAYYLPPLGVPASYLRPVWVLETPAGARYSFDAWTGTPVYP